ncbi:MAG: hypothetical protein RIE73_36980 [Coleofasciculus sp. C1-SOL-03]|jgi:hypothetical protein|uniref:hypothetical protein n=1 Tax=Coleofasciculus sp. C1-SOL-03 TaxID=3069522 RepID=UPI0032FD6D41
MSSPLIAMANRSLFLTVAQLKLNRGLDGLAQLELVRSEGFSPLQLSVIALFVLTTNKTLF